MSQTAARLATYADLLQVPPHLVAETDWDFAADEATMRSCTAGAEMRATAGRQSAIGGT
jgi:hypothetical protein